MRLDFLGCLKNDKTAHAPAAKGDGLEHGASGNNDAPRVVLHRCVLHREPVMKIDGLDRRHRKRLQPSVVDPGSAPCAMHEQE